MDNRIAREQKTIASMVTIFCVQNHKDNQGLCPCCKELLEYSIMRLSQCSFGSEKPVCLKCTVHCYNLEMRDKIKQVMKYSGKRMILNHPLLTIRHLMDSIN